jgi:C-terminal processing protease CtpA/Prc
MVFSLPAGGIAAVCTQYCYKPDNSDYYREGIKPDFDIIQTYQDYISNTDIAKNKAIEYLNKALNK